jgi:hypothetical protein
MKTPSRLLSALLLAALTLDGTSRLSAATPAPAAAKETQGIDTLKGDGSPFKQRAENDGSGGVSLDSPLEYRGLIVRKDAAGNDVTYLGFIDVNTRVTTWARADGLDDNGQPDPSNRITVSGYDAEDEEVPIKVTYTSDTGAKRNYTLMLKTSMISVQAVRNTTQNTNQAQQTQNNQTTAAVQQLLQALGGAGNANVRGGAANQTQFQNQQQGQRGNQRGNQQGGAAGGRGAAGGAAGGRGAAGGAAAGGGGGGRG